MQTFELVLFLLIAVVASSILDRLLPRLSLPLVQIALGIIISLLVSTPLEAGIDPELLLILFIAPLHFNESRHADSGALWANRWGIVSLALGLVVAIVIAVGATLHALLPTIPLAIALALGAAMGSTDAPAVTALSKDFKFGERHETLLQGEALFNDVTGTVIFQCAIAFAVSGTFSIMHAGEEFALDFFGGFIGGAIMGLMAWGILEFIRRCGIDNPTLHVTLELLLPFVIYLVAKRFAIGAVIAVVAAGLVMSLLPHRHTVSGARQRLQSASVWKTIEFILNGIIFVLLGMQLPRLLEPTANNGIGEPAQIILAIIVILIVLEAVRFLWILILDIVHFKREKGDIRHLFTADELKMTLAMAFAGPKGGITLSLMLTIPATLAMGDASALREMVIAIASGVILGTLLLANFCVPLLVPHKHEAKRMRENVDLEVEIIVKTLASVRDALDHGERLASDVTSGKASIDETAAVIVMKRYADQLEELASHASSQTAQSVRALIDEIDALYEPLGDVVDEIQAFDASDSGSGDARPSISDRFRTMRAIYDQVEIVQGQALAHELEFIKELRESGKLDAEHAKELRNDVYIQQLVL